MDTATPNSNASGLLDGQFVNASHSVFNDVRGDINHIYQFNNPIANDLPKPDAASASVVDHYIVITFKNTSDDYITYEYMGKDGKPQQGVLEPGCLYEKRLLVNTPYNFTLRQGRDVRTTGRAFSRIEDVDFAKYFY